MAGKLVQVATNTVSSAVASVSLVGIDTDDVYMLAISNLTPATINADMKLRVTESGTASADSDYDSSAKMLRSDTTFSNLSNTNQDGFIISGSLNNTDGKGFACIVYIYNANNSSEYTYTTHETAYMSEDLTTLLGYQGGGVYTQTTAVDGVNISMVSPTSDIQSGTLTLYKVVGS